MKKKKSNNIQTNKGNLNGYRTARPNQSRKKLFSFFQIDSDTSNYKFSFLSYKFFLYLLDNIR
jgi:hypothetical protein